MSSERACHTSLRSIISAGTISQDIRCSRIRSARVSASAVFACSKACTSRRSGSSDGSVPWVTQANSSFSGPSALACTLRSRSRWVQP